MVSSTRGTTSTVTVPSSTQMRSVFLLQTSVPTLVTQLAPSIPSSTLHPEGAVDDSSAPRDPFQAFQSEPTPSAAGDEHLYSPPTSISTSSQVLPEVTSIQTTYAQPLQTYNSFGNLFPARFFASTSDMARTCRPRCWSTRWYRPSFGQQLC